MHYVYMLQSKTIEGRRYVGVTSDLKRRLAQHNAGDSPHTSKYPPWTLVTYVAFSDARKAETFERYLKSGSGHAFAKKYYGKPSFTMAGYAWRSRTSPRGRSVSGVA